MPDPTPPAAPLDAVPSASTLASASASSDDAEVGEPTRIAAEFTAGRVARDWFTERTEGRAERMRGVELGAVIAAGREEDGPVEYSLQSQRMQRTDNRYPGTIGSVGAQWVHVGVQVCVRRRGRRTPRLHHRRIYGSIFEALEAIAADLTIADEFIVNPLLAELRRAHRAALAEPPEPAEGIATDEASDAESPAEE